MPEPKPCSHPGCQHHVTHPCEGCGKQWGGGAVPQQLELCPFCGVDMSREQRFGRGGALEWMAYHPGGRNCILGGMNFDIKKWNTRPDSKPSFSHQDMEHWAEEYECAMKYLDDVGCHRNNGEKEYSLVGRLKKLTVPDVGPDKVAEKAGEV